MLNNIFQPYHTMQEINLDWILTKVKNILRFVPDDGSVGQILRRTAHGAEWSNEQGGGGAVDSVNGQTGTVVLTASDVGALPDTYVAPVTSVNGQTGDVIVSGGAVDSVNGQTGTVVLGKSDIGLGNVDNVQQYSATNPPPYPVTSVNGQTGAVVIPTATPLDAYPVGSIYISVNSTSPSTLFGGTWERLKDKFLLGAGDTYTAGDTGGEATHTLTDAELPATSGSFKARVMSWGTGESQYTSVAWGASGKMSATSIGTSGTDSVAYYSGATRGYTEVGFSFGSDAAHNNMPPYIVVYMWKRTA